MKNSIKTLIAVVAIASTLPIAADAHHDHSVLVKQYPAVFGANVKRHTLTLKRNQSAASVQETIRLVYGYKALSPVIKQPNITGCYTAVVNTRSNQAPQLIAINCFSANVKGGH